jgi:hypothetical protein
MLLLLYSQKETPVPTEQDAEWDPEPVWTFRRQDKLFFLSQIKPFFLDTVVKGKIQCPYWQAKPSVIAHIQSLQCLSYGRSSHLSISFAKQCPVC